MISIYDYGSFQYKKVKITLLDDSVTTGELLSLDPVEDNDVEDAFVLDVDGDPYIGRPVYVSKIKRIELIDNG
ncbi:hypothetical protein [Eremococcus coleocola]|uniref:Uncharacterized protein n=1 Tax=Eremococcus coleocola ACS-139-V-Col8 TaxID=908337 RepID=E4KQ93_9LACT|nr:hypothetical protein [Eremococcus coleocola]EFR30868.1 hypothetical protein HMPREF9257_1693 [Eremococcus coleocola ACS-139-V-Col8]